jgi:hypothetical protein
LALAGLAASSTAYALLLNTRTGRRFADDQTWSTVVAGVMLTTGWLAVEDRRAAWLNFVYFFVAGIPVIIRSLWLQIERHDAAMRRVTERG